MRRNNRTIVILICMAVLSSIIHYGCKKDDGPDEPDPNQYNCTSNITDGCFDDWKTFTTTSGSYINPMGGFLQSLNELSSLPPETGGPGPATADTVTDCVEGKYAVKLTSKNFTSHGIFVPGYIGASQLDIPRATIHLGKPYSKRPRSLHASYKYAPVGGDSALIQVMLSKYNTAEGKRDTISFNKMIVKNAVSSYTQLDIPLTYLDGASIPDTLIVIFAASAKIDFGNLMSCAGKEGSTLWVDDLEFIFP